MVAGVGPGASSSRDPEASVLPGGLEKFNT